MGPIPPNCVLVGSLPHEEAMTHCAEAAIAILPSRDEALPVFILEAMARRCAVVATPVGQVDSVLADECGVVVPVADPVVTAEALSGLMRDDARRELLASNAYKRVRAEYSAEVVSRRLTQIWTSALGDR